MSGLPELVADYGPALLFAMAVLETCFVTGLVVPAGMATAFATVLAVEGQLALPVVAVAAASGAFLGDLAGYGIGRASGDRLRQGDGWVPRTIRRHDRTLGRFMGRHPLYSVTGARLVAFVRTLMPLSSGMARVPFGRFVVFDVPGVLLWLLLYMGIGWLAGESWRQVSSLVGAGWAVVFAVAGLLLWVRARRRGELRGRAPAAAAAAEAGPPAPEVVPEGGPAGDPEGPRTLGPEAGRDPEIAPERDPC